jgi:uncharacterized protein (DUF2141 family)
MKKALLVMFVAALFLGVAVLGQAAEKNGTIVVIGKNLKDSKGRIGAALFKSADGFPKDSKKAFKRGRAKIKDKKAQIEFKDIPYGEYAVALIHDENENGKMDYNAIGLPKEGYGFSNDAMGTLGPPDFKAAKFKLDSPKKDVPIKLNY